MENEKFVINQIPESGIITILHGAAAPIEVKSPVNLSGTIDSVMDFELKRRGLFCVPSDCHVIINTANRSVVFVTNEQDRVKHTVTGKMIPNPVIEELGINQERNYNMMQLLKILKLRGALFASRSDHAAIIDSLLKFSARTETEFENSNDYKGNVAYKKITKVTHDIPLDFTLNIAPFVGGEKIPVKVVAEVTPDGQSLVCNLISVELSEEMDKKTEETLKAARAHFSNYAIIEQ